MTTINDEIFWLDELKDTDSLIIANLSINANSSIFKGHFPGQPVVPGACMLQIVKDVLQKALGTSLLLSKAANLKFISMIIPANNETAYLELSYKIADDNSIIVNAKLTARIIVGDNTNNGEGTNDIVCFKFQGIFIKE